MPTSLANIPVTMPRRGVAAGSALRTAAVAVPGAPPSESGFAGALSELLRPGGEIKTTGERQDPTGPGKDLPAAVEEQEPLIAWLPAGFIPSVADQLVPSDTQVPAAGSMSPIRMTVGAAMSAASEASPPSAPMPVADIPGTMLPPAGIDTPITAAVTLEAADPGAAEPVPNIDVAPDDPAPRDRFEKPTRDANLIALQPAPSVSPAATKGAAAQVFATALTAAPLQAASLERIGEAAIQLHAQARTEQATTVQPLSSGSQVPLDLTREDWTGRMIDRIAALRESAEAAETRIKLAPENLGALEVSLRRDGDRLHVHFSAENATARQLLAEAAPRLADLADARGIKLGHTSVDGGSSHGGQRDQYRPATATARNASDGSQAERITDDRIA